MENYLHIIAEVNGSSPLPPTIVYGTQNWHLLLSQSFLNQRYRISYQYIVTGYLNLFNKTPDKRFLFGERSLG